MDYASKMRQNTLNYQQTLQRIQEKYSKVTDRATGIDVHFKDVPMKDIVRYMAVSEVEVSRIEAESPSSWRECSFRDANKTQDSQIEYQEANGSESNDSIMDPESTSSFSFRMSEMEHAQAAVDLTVQPEDQDADLERTLNSHHSTLLEMVDQIGKACRRQYISEAANSVLRRYRRQRLKKSLARKTTTPNPQSGGESHRRSVHHPTAFPSPVRRHPDRAEPSPGREVDRARRGQQRPLLAMDFNSSEPSQAVAAMNQTFTVSRGSPHRSLPPGSPLRQTYSPVVRSPAQTLSINRGQGPLFPKTCPNSPARPWFNTKWRSQEGCGGSQDAFARHSNSDSLEAKRARYNPASPSALRKQPPLSPRRMVQQHCPSPSQLRIYSPRSSSATGSLRFQRRHSFDSAPRPSVTCSAARLEEEFTKHYHKFVCQGTSSLANGVPCPCSARRLESSRGSYMSSSSVLSALALSPQRSVLWKRHRELDPDGSPGSKRPRVLTSSPGSLRHHKESRRSPSAPFNGRYLKYIF